jgi:hypothetical protein
MNGPAYTLIRLLSLNVMLRDSAQINGFVQLQSGLQREGDSVQARD